MTDEAREGGTTGHQAANDMRFLLSRGYTRKNSLSIVSSRYRVTGEESRMLFRGVYDDSTAGRHREKCLPPERLAHKVLGVDWFNVLITVDSGLGGDIIVDSDDGFLRDIRGLHGRHPEGGGLQRAADTILRGISELGASEVFIFLDANVSRSGDTAALLREALSETTLTVEVTTTRTPDTNVASKGVSLSSDSVIVENSRNSFDLPRHVLSGLEGVAAYVLR
ncbi:MAG: DUF434 domain-containing protein [Candidatus Geothermarchaeales archaeon]